MVHGTCSAKYIMLHVNSFPVNNTRTLCSLKTLTFIDMKEHIIHSKSQSIAIMSKMAYNI